MRFQLVARCCSRWTTRFVVGIGSGLGLVISPLYLSEIAPSKISGNVGVLTQLGIVLGIFLTQLIGLIFATPSGWRLVFLYSFALGVVQWLASSLMVNPPRRLSSKEEIYSVERRIWGLTQHDTPPTGDETEPLFEASEVATPDARTSQKSLTLSALIFHPPKEVHRPMVIVCCAMLAQQISGINAVLYYSNEILSKSLPDLGPYVSLAITIVNVLMTFPPIVLVERLGRRQLLTISTLGALLSLLTVGIAMDSDLGAIASVGIVTFVMSFAVGLGPIPFIMIPEVSPFHVGW